MPNPVGRRTLQRVWLLRTEWGIGERLAVRARVPYRDISASGLLRFSGSGLGDVEAWAMWRLGPEKARGGGAVGGGLAFPTGEDAPSEGTSESVFFGAGAFSALVSVEGFRRVTGSHQVFGLARYRLPLGTGDENYRFGDNFGWAATWRWQPREGAVGLSAGLTGQHLGRDEQNGDQVDNRGGRLNYATAGVDVRLPRGLTLSVLSLWLVDQDVRGDQLLAKWQAITGLTWSWGKHEHAGDAPDHADD